MPETILLSASIAPVVSFAMHQASVPVISELRLTNPTGETIDGVTVSLTCEPQLIAPRKWTFDRIAAGSEQEPADRTVSLEGGLLYKLSERMPNDALATSQGLDALCTVLEDRTQACARLRKSSPFAGLLPQDERAAILAESKEA